MSMRAETTTIHWLMLLATCITVLVQPGVAHQPPPIGTIPFPNIPGLPWTIPLPNIPGLPLPPPIGTIPLPNIPGLPVPQLNPQEIQKCWSSLLNIQGCIWEIYRSVLSAQIGRIGPDCCKAFTSIDQNCWPKMFPFNPFFPPMLKNGCTGSASAPPPPKAD